MPRKTKKTPEDAHKYRTGQTNEKGQVICGAKTKTRNGIPCPSTGVMLNGRCRMHGGPTPSGPDASRWKHGKYSSHLPTRLLQQYQEARQDPDLLVLKDEIALMEVREIELIKQIDKGESGRLWRTLKETFQAFKEAQRAEDLAAASMCLTQIDQLLTQGTAQYAIWAEIFDISESRRRMTESERKREFDLEQFLPITRALVLFGAIGAIIREEEPDAGIRSRIDNRIRGLIDKSANRVIDQPIIDNSPQP